MIWSILISRSMRLTDLLPLTTVTKIEATFMICEVWSEPFVIVITLCSESDICEAMSPVWPSLVKETKIHQYSRPSGCRLWTFVPLKKEPLDTSSALRRGLFLRSFQVVIFSLCRLKLQTRHRSGSKSKQHFTSRTTRTQWVSRYFAQSKIYHPKAREQSTIRGGSFSF